MKKKIMLCILGIVIVLIIGGDYMLTTFIHQLQIP